jgi:hypothetical protein
MKISRVCKVNYAKTSEEERELLRLDGGNHSIYVRYRHILVDGWARRRFSVRHI